MAYYFSPFRNSYSGDKKKIEGKKECPFCSEENIKKQGVRNVSGTLMENEHYFWIVNFFPKFEGHTMLVPKRHLKHPEEETRDELVSRHTLGLFAMKQLEKVYPGCGFEIFLQFGAGSEQSVEHLHWHIVPAQKGDTLRSFEKLGHFYTKKEEEEKIILFPVPICLAREDLLEKLTETIGGETFPSSESSSRDSDERKRL